MAIAGEGGIRGVDLRQSDEEKRPDRRNQRDRDQREAHPVEAPPRDRQRRGDEPEEERLHVRRVLLHQAGDDAGASDERRDDARAERQQQPPIGGAPVLARFRPIPPHRIQPKRHQLADRGDEPLVDVDDQRDGAAANAGDDVGAAHQQAADEVVEVVAEALLHGAGRRNDR
jgi:hypothetical protein